MYPKYPHDIERQQQDFAERSLENDVVNGILKSGRIVIPCTANAGASQAVVFPIPFTPATIPDIMVCITSLGVLPSVVKYLVGASATATGFTIQLLTDTTQNITVTWYGKGITS